jgi:serine O-acetyltransferase
MRTSLSSAELATYLGRQMSAFFPDRAVEGTALTPAVAHALERLDHCFSRIRLKYFQDEKGTRFDHQHTDHYAMFLYLVGRAIYEAQGDLGVAAKAYALNKALHGLDAFYEVQLPSVFAFQHPLGTVLGRGTYSDYFFVYQRCSIGANLDGEYPRLGEGIVMFGGAAVIGKCQVEGNCWLSVNTVVMDQDVPRGSAVFGRSPALTIKPTSRDVTKELFLR